MRYISKGIIKFDEEDKNNSVISCIVYTVILVGILLLLYASDNYMATKENNEIAETQTEAYIEN